MSPTTREAALQRALEVVLTCGELEHAKTVARVALRTDHDAGQGDLLGGFGDPDPGALPERTGPLEPPDYEPRPRNQRGKILHYIARCTLPLQATRTAGGAIASDVERALGFPTSSVSKRLGELEEAGYIERTQRTRASLRGAPSHVYVATPRGLRWVAEHRVELERGA